MSRKRRQTRLGRAFSILSWPAAVVLPLIGLAWTVSGLAWGLDLIANLDAQWLVGAAGALLLWALTRRWRHAAFAAVACALLGASLLIGRAAVLPRPVDVSGPPADGAVRFFHYNASTLGEGGSIEALMDRSHADVLSVLCPPVAQQRAVIYGDRLSDRFAGKLVRRWRPDPVGDGTDVTAAFVVSRWPMHALDVSWVGAGADYLIAARVERPAPGGPFALIAVHPRSPRNADRWAAGNAVAEATGRVARRLEDEGMAVVVLADLNSTPSGYRSRLLHRLAGLRRAKPLLSVSTTYPLPLGPRDDSQAGPRRWCWGPLGIAIDDALVSPGVGVAGWSVLPKLESEHSPIVVDLRIPGGAASVAPGPGR